MNLPALSLEKKLALAAVALGALAMFGPDPYSRAYAKVKVSELAARADRGADRVEALALAEMILQGTKELQLVDLRPAEAYAKGAIPGATNLALQDLLAAPELKAANVLLYAEDDLLAAQAWVLARTTGFTSVRVVAGGMKAWNDEVLYPVLATAATAAEAQRLERRKQVSLAFGGSPRLAGAAPAAVTAPKPKAVQPAGGATGGGGAKPKKKREGC